MSDSPEFSASFKALTDYLDGRKYNYNPYPEENRIAFSVCGHHADYRIQFRITHEGDYCQMVLNYPFRVRDEKLRLSVAELITRANYKMVVGKFEMDMSDGEVRYHVAHLIDGSDFTAEIVERIYMTALYTMDRYFPALMQHIHAGYTPEDAVFHAELDSHADSVEETPKPAPKAQEKVKPASASDPSSTPAASSKKPQKKKGKGTGNQDELPL